MNKKKVNCPECCNNNVILLRKTIFEMILDKDGDFTRTRNVSNNL